MTERANVRMILNGVIGLLLLVNGYLAYDHLTARALAEKESEAKAAAFRAKPVQLNVLNGCGDAGIAAHCTDFLRTRGFDVVEMKNFPATGIPRTLVVDRVGNAETAGLVARAIGLDESSVIHQVNPNLFVEVTIILGNDYKTLVPFHQ